MKYIGVDYSMSTPAMCILGDDLTPQSSKMYYLTDNKKSVVNIMGISSRLHKPYTTQQERFNNIAEYFIDNIPKDDEISIAIEDYSFGSKGKVFHIAENLGHLKYKLWDRGFNFELFAPSVIKKYATTKGNADKEKMYECFVKETGMNFNSVLFPTKKLGSPITDIVDAYYIARYLRYLKTKP